MEEAENIIKEMWIKDESLDIDSIPDNVRGYLQDEGLIEVKNGKAFLTEKGKKRAEKIIRLHRLAERLLSDILGMEEEDVEKSACKFEHFISEEVEEAICTLLGHPRFCPHGSEIPKGKCCEVGEREVERLIFKLSELNAGDEGEIKYVVGGKGVSSKFIAFGIMPGEEIKVLRVFPTYIIQIGNTQFALDKELADSIYVLKKSAKSSKNDTGPGRKRRRWGWFR
ncbi:hypothetical protein Asulf_00983 [Archaeoglobus sulfaticallidus PM70-1]|uniref:Ferrous iron transporter FeoA-like domain-containing protein n=1 Tax=Archaeoglobus sulfaticallidus PM70-1 TaxID=387631 RepID=N0BFF7_9EURY|nr:metal-dependent transcriptional regulator [Archaeoglobus sulfaticallidus]AGK60987.1 hypothetical protein Asulf_00983 [Archaeoglobus sulfaticallidus PM70-1]